jgi:type IV secretory pathway protease TraF
VALIAVVALALARSAVVDVPTAAIMLLSAILIGWFRVNSAWVIVGAALAGLLV